MLDIKLIREETDKVREALRNRNDNPDSVDRVLELDERRRAILTEKEQLQARRNELSKQVHKAAPDERAALIEESKAIGPRIAALDKETDEVEEALRQVLLTIPNVPHESVPIGKDEEANVVIRQWGEPRAFEFEPLALWDIGVRHALVDFERACKISGSRF